MGALIAALVTGAELNMVPIVAGVAKGVLWDRMLPTMFAGHRRRVEARQARKLGGICKKCGQVREAVEPAPPAPPAAVHGPVA